MPGIVVSVIPSNPRPSPLSDTFFTEHGLNVVHISTCCHCCLIFCLLQSLCLRVGLSIFSTTFNLSRRQLVNIKFVPAVMFSLYVITTSGCNCLKFNCCNNLTVSYCIYIYIHVGRSNDTSKTSVMSVSWYRNRYCLIFHAVNWFVCSINHSFESLSYLLNFTKLSPRHRVQIWFTIWESVTSN